MTFMIQFLHRNILVLTLPAFRSQTCKLSCLPTRLVCLGPNREAPLADHIFETLARIIDVLHALEMPSTRSEQRQIPKRFLWHLPGRDKLLAFAASAAFRTLLRSMEALVLLDLESKVHQTTSLYTRGLLLLGHALDFVFGSGSAWFESVIMAKNIPHAEIEADKKLNRVSAHDRPHEESLRNETVQGAKQLLYSADHKLSQPAPLEVRPIWVGHGPNTQA
ncbi:hypothetical protein MJO28_004411 [Puccinia striiformis f. sp. tritici]|uniref:Uncharacterized protein n=1 Tax=Puccinia striiformis f. sp. tritici TaxID=168172 RepID=A0ACC0EPQ8_9BASI|nr:hypothetical protein MJO28_004411 [Puccinia striiformis f. sp. tritici]KAI7963455.1 hypothetical protein MJO29_003882 [Puccinia striiformis f. sp. tritici]